VPLTGTSALKTRLIQLKRMNCLSLAVKCLPNKIKYFLKDRFSIPGMEWSMKNMKYSGFNPRYVLDIGAYKGEWTLMCKKIFPNSSILMIEPQKNNKTILEKVTKKYPDCSYKIALLGAQESENVTFLHDGSGSGVTYDTADVSKEYSLMNLTTLNTITKDSVFKKSALLKMDVQGYELEVIKGGNDVLQNAEVVIMEISLIGLIEKAPLFYDVVIFMHDLGFRIYDICTFIRRPVDKALWQIDAIFVRNNSYLGAASKGWR
jgi:FkbM family methyltransferase